MAIFDIYSKRRRRLRGEIPDVYQYDNMPPPFRVQVVNILQDVLGVTTARGGIHLSFDPTEKWFNAIYKSLAREYGVFQLHKQGNTSQEIVFDFLLSTEVEKVLDVIEISLQLAYELESNNERLSCVPDAEQNLDEAVDELNARFREHGIGYRFESGQVVRIDSEFLHQEVVKPALHLLKASHFAGAEQEFHKAHEHYRHQRFQESINESLKALESTLKVICKRKGWSFSERDVASKLIQIVFDRGLIPNYLQSQFNGLRTILEGGVPTIRNRDSGHGTGTTPRQVPAHLAAYALHLTASAIVFLAGAAKK